MSENKPMDAEQAISLLDQVCAQVSLTRENHQRVLVAVGVIKKLASDNHNGILKRDGIDGHKDQDPARKSTSQDGLKNGKVPQETIEAPANG